MRMEHNEKQGHPEHEILKEILSYAREASTASSEIPENKQVEHIERVLLAALERKTQ